jgi:hypothetical protein
MLKLGAEFARHDTVDHSNDEYARCEGDTIITTNTIESYFSGLTAKTTRCQVKRLAKRFLRWKKRHD